MKKAAKFLAQKFATGASVSKNPQGFDEIVIQGDVTEEVVRHGSQTWTRNLIANVTIGYTLRLT